VIETATHSKGQAGTGVLIDDGKDTKGFSICGAVINKVITPYVIGILRAQADTGAVVEPQASSLGLFSRDFESFLSPESVDSLGIHLPPFFPQCEPGMRCINRQKLDFHGKHSAPLAIWKSERSPRVSVSVVSFSFVKMPCRPPFSLDVQGILRMDVSTYFHGKNRTNIIGRCNYREWFSQKKMWEGR